MTITSYTSPVEKQLGHTYIGALIVGMREALQKLNVEPDPVDLERWAIFIHESMSISSRNYHSVKHVFDISNGWQDDPIGVLSAYFHDCIYYHVDGGLSAFQKAILHDVLFVERGKTYLTEQDDELLVMTEHVFGFSPGQELLPLQGLNEFLSAVIAVRQLQHVLDKKTLCKIACCIEATIPFRAGDPMEALYQRMTGLLEDEDECVEAVQRAAQLSNRDVGNFGTEDRAWFLDNTWSLLPETNESLRRHYLYTVKDFQFAIYKMNGFFSFLDPNVIFSSFRGVPDVMLVQKMTMQAKRNLQVGKKYVHAKLMAVSLLAAFCELTGDDAPMSLFMGDLPSRHHKSWRLEDDLLPQSFTSYSCVCDPDVLHILAHGRKTETSFDIRQSPLAAYLYGCMGDEGFQRFQSSIGPEPLYPMTKQRARTFLRFLPRNVLLAVAENMAKVAVSRATLIAQIANDPEQEEEQQQ